MSAIKVSPAAPIPEWAPGAAGYSLLTGYVEGAVYAGFWRRALAWLIDYAIFLAGIVTVFFFLGFLLAIALASSGQGKFDGQEWTTVFNVLAYLVGIPAYWFYYALAESSRRQATLGKRALGLIVTDLQGGRISFGRATGRHFGKILSSLIFGAGFVMAGFSQRKQTLHDQDGQLPGGPEGLRRASVPAGSSRHFAGAPVAG